MENTQNTVKNTKRKKIILAVFLLLITGAAVFGYLFYHSPKVTVARALKNTFGEDRLGFSLSDALTLAESRDYSGTADITLSRLSLPEEVMGSLPFDPVHLEGLSLATAYRINGVDEMNASYGSDDSYGSGASYVSETQVSYLMKPYVRLESYADQDTLALRLPELFHSWLSVNPKTLGSDYNASLLSKLSGVTLPKDLSLSLFSDTPAARLSADERKELLKKSFREAEVTRLEDNASYEIVFAQETSDASKPSDAKSYDFASSVKQMRLTINEKDEIETLTVHFMLPLQGQNYPADLTLTPASPVSNDLQGELTILPTDSDENISSLFPLTLTFSAYLEQEDDEQFILGFEELTFASNEAQLTFYGKFSIASKDMQSASLPVYEPESALDFFSLDLKDFLRLGKEMFDNLDKSELRVLKGFLS